LLGSDKNAKPTLKWAIDGVVTREDTERFDLILVPAMKHNGIKCGIDIAYNSNSLSEMTRQDIEEYFVTINGNRPKFIFHQNSNFNLWKESSRGHVEVLARDFPIDCYSYEECYRAISPFMGAHGRYREYMYIRRDMIG
jgi:hypothetical protein